jgi:exodeoxyribonuclease-3
VRIATWNVNGIRAREQQLDQWLTRDEPDVVCLQEIKASPTQVPTLLVEMKGYWGYWHGAGGYSGVALLVKRSLASERPAFSHPHFDHEHRIVTARVGDLTIASVYVPNGGKDFEAKMRFLEAMEVYVGEQEKAGSNLVLCGDLNVAHADIDVHPKERKLGAIGQRPEERAIFDRILSHGMVDVGRALDPDNAELFSWWPPWRNMRQRNIGWRIDYVLASSKVAPEVSACRVLADVGTSDHAPVMITRGA